MERWFPTGWRRPPRRARCGRGRDHPRGRPPRAHDDARPEAGGDGHALLTRQPRSVGPAGGPPALGRRGHPALPGPGHRLQAVPRRAPGRRRRGGHRDREPLRRAVPLHRRAVPHGGRHPHRGPSAVVRGREHLSGPCSSPGHPGRRRSWWPRWVPRGTPWLPTPITWIRATRTSSASSRLSGPAWSGSTSRPSRSRCPRRVGPPAGWRTRESPPSPATAPLRRGSRPSLPGERQPRSEATCGEHRARSVVGARG